MVFIFVLNFGTHGGSITGKDSIPSFGLGRVNSICDGATFIDICPFSSSLCHTCWRFFHSALEFQKVCINKLKKFIENKVVENI